MPMSVITGPISRNTGFLCRIQRTALRYERIHRSGKKSGGQEQLPAEAGAGLPVAPGSVFRSQSQGLCLRSQLVARL